MCPPTPSVRISHLKNQGDLKIALMLIRVNTRITAMQGMHWRIMIEFASSIYLTSTFYIWHHSGHLTPVLQCSHFGANAG